MALAAAEFDMTEAYPLERTAVNLFLRMNV
jgi:hypothetical protein